MGKFSVFFSSNIYLNLRQNIVSVLNIQEADGDCFYLCLPNLLGRNKSVLFEFLKAKLLQKFSS